MMESQLLAPSSIGTGLCNQSENKHGFRMIEERLNHKRMNCEHDSSQPPAERDEDAETHSSGEIESYSAKIYAEKSFADDWKERMDSPPLKLDSMNLTESFDQERTTQYAASNWQSDGATGKQSTKPEKHSLPSSAAKSCAKKSFVWKYFRHPELVSGVTDRSRTQCILCESQLAFNASGTTTTMLNHLKSRHGEVAEQEELQRRHTRTKVSANSNIVVTQDERNGDAAFYGTKQVRQSRSPNSSQRGRSTGTVKRQKLAKLNNGSEGQNQLFLNGHAELDTTALFPFGCYPGLTEQQHRALLNEMLLSTEVIKKNEKAGFPNLIDQRQDLITTLPTNFGFPEKGMDQLAESSLAFAGTKLFSPTLLNKNTLLNAMNAFSNGLNFPLTANFPVPVTHELSPSSSSGLGVSVSSPSGATTTSASPVGSAENSHMKSPTQQSHWSVDKRGPTPFNTILDGVNLPKDLSTSNGISSDQIGTVNSEIRTQLHPMEFIQKEHGGSVKVPLTNPKSMLDMNETLGNLMNFVPPITSVNSAVPFSNFGAFPMVPPHPTEQEKHQQQQWLTSAWLSSIVSNKSMMGSNAIGLMDPSVVLNLLSNSNNMAKYKVGIDSEHTSKSNIGKVNQCNGQPGTIDQTEKHVNWSQPRNVTPFLTIFSPELNEDLKPISDSVARPLDTDGNETLDLSQANQTNYAQLQMTGEESSGNITSSTKRKRAKPMYISPDDTAKKSNRESLSSASTENLWSSDEMREKDSPSFDFALQQTSHDILTKKLVRYLVNDMVPPVVVEGEGFKVLMTYLTKQNLPSVQELRDNIFPQAIKEARSILDENLSAYLKRDDDVQGDSEITVALVAELWQPGSEVTAMGTLKLDDATFANIEIQALDLQRASSLRQMCDCIALASPKVLRNQLEHQARAIRTSHKDGSVMQSWPIPVVTNRSADLTEILSVQDEGDTFQFLVIPCLVSELARSVQVGLKTERMKTLLNKCKNSSAKQSLTEETSLGASTDDQKSLDISWSDACAIIQSSLQSMGDGSLSASELELLEQLRTVLETLNQSLQLLHQKNLQLTASMIDPMLHTLTETHFAPDSTMMTTTSESPDVKEFKALLTERLQQSYPLSGPLRDALQLASLLDPRFKDHVQDRASAAVNLLKQKTDEFPSNNSISQSSSSHSVEQISPKSTTDTGGLQTVFGLQRCNRISLSEVDRYLREDPIGLEQNPFQWWREKANTYPRLAVLASYYLNIPLTCFPHGRLKSTELNLSTLQDDGLGLPNLYDPLAGGRARISPVDQSAYNFLWHQWMLR